MGSCPNCSTTLVGVSCKLRCTRCGYFESCSDLEPHPPLSDPATPRPVEKAPSAR